MDGGEGGVDAGRPSTDAEVSVEGERGVIGAEEIYSRGFKGKAADLEVLGVPNGALVGPPARARSRSRSLSRSFSSSSSSSSSRDLIASSLASM